MLNHIPTPVLIDYIDGLRKMLSDGDEAGVISAVQSLDDLAEIRPELHAQFLQGIASICNAQWTQN